MNVISNFFLFGYARFAGAALGSKLSIANTIPKIDLFDVGFPRLPQNLYDQKIGGNFLTIINRGKCDQ